MVIAPARGSTAQPQREPSPTNPPNDDDDDVIMVDFVQQSPVKRKDEGDQPSPRPAKRRSFWVEVPPRRKASVKRESSSPEVTTSAEGAVPVPKEEPDQEFSNALAVIRNVSRILQAPIPEDRGTTEVIPALFHLLNRQISRKIRKRWMTYPYTRGSQRSAWISFR